MFYIAMIALHFTKLAKMQHVRLQVYNDGRLSIKNVSNSDGGQYKLDSKWWTVQRTRTVQGQYKLHTVDGQYKLDKDGGQYNLDSNDGQYSGHGQYKVSTNWTRTVQTGLKWWTVQWTRPVQGQYKVDKVDGQYKLDSNDGQYSGHGQYKVSTKWTQSMDSTNWTRTADSTNVLQWVPPTDRLTNSLSTSSSPVRHFWLALNNYLH